MAKHIFIHVGARGKATDAAPGSEESLRRIVFGIEAKLKADDLRVTKMSREERRKLEFLREKKRKEWLAAVKAREAQDACSTKDTAFKGYEIRKNSLNGKWFVYDPLLKKTAWPSGFPDEAAAQKWVNEQGTRDACSAKDAEPEKPLPRPGDTVALNDPFAEVRVLAVSARGAVQVALPGEKYKRWFPPSQYVVKGGARDALPAFPFKAKTRVDFRMGGEVIPEGTEVYVIARNQGMFKVRLAGGDPFYVGQFKLVLPQ